MIVLLIAVLVIVVGVVVAAVLGRFEASMDQPVRTTAFQPLPEGALSDADLDQLRFDQTLRGYRMGQVDDVIDRLREELADRDAEIRRLRDEAGA
ncbi:DivIVA domain-containing protein [Calidifontibacter sp. DB0510]|uniref:DivIVA domain-containing protein n=1 Tax=Metallococcus carri TaxID=1656884 RepID=A0A967EDU8_9MICO|nr:DivIVA domain-containing protein [Metallococcus carri]NHN55066.1 DivIVA domain-containing protein [Metallococcus carri]NOP36143.1 DivIVA domain-containing protein [Calidifontibacter sp. DB2511S]